MNALQNDNYHPHYHFSPSQGWMNDPNGLLYLDGTWHLFFQYYPNAPIHGPMYWGHATSCDLVSWQEQPIALCPQGSIYMFSGSAVVDYCNTSGFGSADTTLQPLVAIYTAHDTAQTDPNETENQALAYSLDGGTTWTQYSGNPVLQSPGLPNFRDPKVSWDAGNERWLMVLAAGDRVHFYESPNLKDWTFLSEFGEGCGAHGGVWECPDLFSLPVKTEFWEDGLDGDDCEPCTPPEKKWVLLVSINPGGPNVGSATQYFVGDFDGTTFTPDECCAEGRAGNDSAQNETVCDRWVDWGRDNYAGVTFNNVPCNRRVMIGWMSNWDYAADLPSAADGWLGQMTIPRELSLVSNNEGYVLKSWPVPELFARREQGSRLFLCGKAETANEEVPMISFGELDLTRCVIKVWLHGLGAGKTSLIFRNPWGKELRCGIKNPTDSENAELFIDRSGAGSEGLPANFPVPVMTAPIAGGPCSSQCYLILLDKTSIELFPKEAKQTMTALFFLGDAPFTEMGFSTESPGATFSLEAYALHVDNCEP